MNKFFFLVFLTLAAAFVLFGCIQFVALHLLTSALSFVCAIAALLLSLPFLEP